MNSVRPRLVKIATWNVNSVKARLPNLLAWLREAAARHRAAAGNQVRRRGVPAHGDRGARLQRRRRTARRPTTASPSCRSAPLEDVRRGLPGRRRRRAGALHRGDAASAIGAARRLDLPAQRQSGRQPRSSPTSSPGWSGCARHAQDLLADEEPLVLGGDYNVIPDAERRPRPEAWRGRRAVPAREPRAFRALLSRPDRRLPRPASGRAARLHLLGLPGRRLAARQRHPHRPPAAVAPGRRPAGRDATSTRRRAAGKRPRTTPRRGASCRRPRHPKRRRAIARPLAAATVPGS